MINQIPSDSLMEFGRVFRRPVQEWATSVVGELERAGDVADLEQLRSASEAVNNAALLMTCVGQSSLAERFCHLQLQWLEFLIPRYGISVVAALALQPWANIARLYRQAGQCERALGQLAVLQPDPNGYEIKFGPFMLEVCEMQRERFDNFHVLDSMKTFFYARDYARGLSFIEHSRTRIAGDTTALLLDEGEVTCALRLHDLERAAAVLERVTWKSNGYSLAVCSLYWCTLMAMHNRIEDKVLSNIVTQFCKALEFPQCLDHRTLRYCLDLARLLVAIQRQRMAQLVTSTMLARSESRDDVPLLYELVSISESCNGDKRQEFATDNLRDILVKNGYIAYAKRQGLIAALPEDAARAIEAMKNRVNMLFDAVQIKVLTHS